MKNTFTLSQVGADVEVFLKDVKSNKVVTAIGKIGGTKEAPQFILGDGYSALQEDNVMAEFNIVPSNTSWWLRDNVRRVLDVLTFRCKEQGLVVDISPSQEFSADDLNHPQAQQIGCSPDYNAWSLSVNPTLSAEILGNIRTAGGHLHVSYFSEDINVDTQCKVVRMLDLTLGVPSVLLDGDNRRRQFYGKAGAYRPKQYGVEYRTLSNFWIKAPSLVAWTHNQVEHAFKLLNEKPDNLLPNDDCQQIINCINKADKKLARSLIRNYNLFLPV